jgi:hypothetical protein
VYKADQKVYKEALARDKAKKEKEIQELKTEEAIAKARYLDKK